MNVIRSIDLFYYLIDYTLIVEQLKTEIQNSLKTKSIRKN